MTSLLPRVRVSTTGPATPHVRPAAPDRRLAAPDRRLALQLNQKARQLRQVLVLSAFHCLDRAVRLSRLTTGWPAPSTLSDNPHNVHVGQSIFSV